MKYLSFLIAGTALALIANYRPLLPTLSQPTDTSTLTISEIVALAAQNPEFLRSAAQSPDPLPADSPARGFSLAFAEMHARLSQTGSADLLSQPGSYTLFLPIDSAFQNPPDLVDFPGRLSDPTFATPLMRYHILGQSVPGSIVGRSDRLHSVDNLDIIVRPDRNGVFMNNAMAQVILADIPAANGVIHVVNGLLVPPYVPNGGDLRLAIRRTDIRRGPDNLAPASPPLAQCRTVYVTRFANGYYELRDIGGWVSFRDLIDVREDYQQPGGQPLLAECAPTATPTPRPPTATPSH
jgi:uncharacterized surface protein with fasciclin (FAS1) repeats